MTDTSLSPGAGLPDPTDPVAVAAALLRCESVTPAEGGALDLLQALLEGLGFAVSRPVFEAEGTPPIENLFAKIGTGAPHFAFAGHTDVVPPGDPAAWQFPPFAGHIDGDVLHGRGAVDMKGGIASFVGAAARFLKTNPQTGTISLLITGDEEGPAVNGTVKLMRWCADQGEQFDACIVGEPTNRDRLGDTIKIGRRGSLSGTVTVEGTQGHVAYPHLADNPVPRLVRLLSSLTATQPDGGTEHFQATNLEVVSIDVGNPAWNVIPADAQARFNVRYNDTWTAKTLKCWIRDRLAEGAGESTYTLSFEPSVSDVFLTRSDALIERLRAAVTAETGLDPELTTGGGTSDARFIKDYCPVIEFGLVGQTMHKIDERVALNDLTALSTIYERFLTLYFPNS